MLLNQQGHLLSVPDVPSTLDFAVMLNAGIKHCQALSGELWTDYNEHDPGLTTLEQLCYALTDLAYRSTFPMADLLAGQAASDSALLTGNRMLVSEPLTETDYRTSLWRDRDTNIKNVWLEAVPAESSGVPGMYNMYIELYRTTPDDAGTEAMLRERYAGSRNLCEDLHQVTLLTPYPLQVSAVVDIALERAAEQVLADLLYALQDLLVPFIEATSVERQLAAGVAPEHIFCGPDLHGLVVDTARMAPRRRSLAVAEVAAAMQAVPGVLALSHLSLGTPDVASLTSGSLTIDDTQVARLAPSIFAPPTDSGAIVLTCQGQPLAVDSARVSQLLAMRLKRLGQHGVLIGPQVQAYATLPAGQQRDLARYVSIQRHFPQTYGIGEGGVQLGYPQSAQAQLQADERIAQARQLKAYLLFFEQILADSGAQLANAGRLLSLEQRLGQGYFWQSLLTEPDGPPAMLELLRSAPVPVARADPLRYSVRLATTAGGASVLRSAEFASMGEASAAAARIAQQGRDARAYTARPLPNGEVLLLLGAPAAPLAFASRRYPGSAAAMAAATHLAALLTRLDKDAGALAQHLTIACHGDASITLLGHDLTALLTARGLTPAESAAWLPQLLRYGIHRANYHVASDSDGRAYVTLATAQRVFAAGVARFATPAEAADSVPFIVGVVQSLCDNAALQANRIVLQPPAPAPAPDPAVCTYNAGMDHIANAGVPWTLRRSALLDHLLARVNEQFDMPALRQTDPDGGPGATSSAFEQQLVDAKLAFLRHYTGGAAGTAGAGVGLGSGRMRGAHGAQRSGLASRILLLLGIAHQPSDTAIHLDPVIVIEHVLLCADAGAATTTAPAGDLSVVMALELARFRMPAFQALARQVLWQNCPAHLAARLIWLEPQQMAPFRDLSARWMQSPLGLPGNKAAAIALANFLSAAADAP